MKSGKALARLEEAWGTSDGGLDAAVWRRAKADAADLPAGLAGSAGAAGNAYTFAVIDSQDLISTALETQIAACAQYVIGLVGRYIEWHGTLDFVVDIRPASELTFSDADGLLPSVAQIGWNGTGWVNQTLEECLTGVDSDLGKPDAGCTIYLADDGTIRNYGTPVWFDANPRQDTHAGVPAGTHDFVGIYTHEIFHSLGFYAVTEQWKARIETEGGVSYFTGANAVSLFGTRIPFLAGTDHYGNAADPGVGISRGLMFQYGNYEGNRLDIGRIDLAILADLGHRIKTADGLPLFELIDGQLDLDGTGGADNLYGDYHDNVLDGKAGSDRVEGGAGSDTIAGGAGNDVLNGAAGADRLVGGDGRDRLSGGDGADIFDFTRLTDSQTALRSDGKKQLPDVIIAAFVSGEDRIDLSAIDAIAGTAANDAFAFIGTGAFTGQAGEVRYDLRSGQAIVSVDVDGDRGADLHIVVATPILLATDFIL